MKIKCNHLASCDRYMYSIQSNRLVDSVPRVCLISLEMRKGFHKMCYDVDQQNCPFCCISSGYHSFQPGEHHQIVNSTDRVHNKEPDSTFWSFINQKDNMYTTTGHNQSSLYGSMWRVILQIHGTNTDPYMVNVQGAAWFETFQVQPDKQWMAASNSFLVWPGRVGECLQESSPGENYYLPLDESH